MAYRRREDDLSDILSEEDVEELLLMRKRGSTLQELADEFDVHRNTIRNIIRRDQNRKRNNGNE